MQVVINVNEEVYSDIMFRAKNTPRDMDNYDLLIANGTPLPKGHGRLVDIDKVSTELDWLEKVTNEGSAVEQTAHRKLAQCMNVVNVAPTIIEADKAGEEE